MRFLSPSKASLSVTMRLRSRTFAACRCVGVIMRLRRAWPRVRNHTTLAAPHSYTVYHHAIELQIVNELSHKDYPNPAVPGVPCSIVNLGGFL